jgi:hypothetical protein
MALKRSVKSRVLAATHSNCGNTLKSLLPSVGGNSRRGQGNDLGYGKNARDSVLQGLEPRKTKMGNPQPSPKSSLTQLVTYLWMQFID